MFRSVSIRLKIVLLSGLCLLVLIGVVVGLNIYQNAKSSNLVSNEAIAMFSEGLQALLISKAGEKSSQIKAEFQDGLSVVNALHDHVMQVGKMDTFTTLQPSTVRSELNKILNVALQHNPQLLGVWLVLEPDALAGADARYVGDLEKGANESGRFSSYWSRASAQGLNTPITEKDLANSAPGISGVPYNMWYTCPASTGKTCLLEPYLDTSTGQPLLMTTVARPLLIDGAVRGVVGVDIALSTLQDAAMNASKELFEGAGIVTIISSSGVIAGSSDKLMNIGQKIDPRAREGEASLAARIKQDAPVVAHDGDTFRASFPLVPIPGATPWTVIIDLPEHILDANTDRLRAIMSRSEKQSVAVTLAGAAIAVLVGLALMWIVATRITRPINAVAARLRDISEGEGDLTCRLSHVQHDELGALVDGFNRFLNKLQPIIKSIHGSVSEARGTANQASEIARLTSIGMETQFREVDQVATASHEMSTTASEVARSASNAATAAQGADRSTKDGIAIIERSTANIQHLADEVSNAVREVEALALNSQQIGGVLEVIRGVAEQTNLLALNAAIEAARAGETGRGFAVVADEVRNLASRTRDSVEQIRGVIQEIQSGTDGVVLTMQASHVKAQESAEQVRDASAALERISQAVSVITDMNIQIASAAEEQSAVAEEVNRNVSAIRVVTETLNGQASESAHVSQQLNSLANQQLQLVEQFKV